jgi:uncharacterized protein
MFYQVHADHISLSLKVSANAPKNEIKSCSANDERLIIKIRAVREKGLANKELIAYLSSTLKIPQKQFLLLRGETSPQKVLAIYGLSEKKLLQVLGI